MGFSADLRKEWIEGKFGSGAPAQLRFRLLRRAGGTFSAVSAPGLSNPVETNNRGLFPLCTINGLLVQTSNQREISFGSPTVTVDDVWGFQVEDLAGAILIQQQFDQPLDFAAGLPIRFKVSTLILSLDDE